MKLSKVLAIFWLSGAIVVAAPIAARAALFITEIQTQTTSGTAGAINGDWWELTNFGAAAINLGGYMWADTEDDLYGSDPAPNIFPSYLIAPGESVIILDHPVANEAAWRTNWGLGASVEVFTSNEMSDSPPDGDTFSGLGSSNDAVYVYDPMGNLVDGFGWGSNVRGTTFEFGFNGADLGLSVVGENGAVLGGNGDIGSPGSAVPEPATIAGLLIGLGLIASTRRGR